jgi:hypothetical protein
MGGLEAGVIQGNAWRGLIGADARFLDYTTVTGSYII